MLQGDATVIERLLQRLHDHFGISAKSAVDGWKGVHCPGASAQSCSGRVGYKPNLDQFSSGLGPEPALAPLRFEDALVALVGRRS